MVIVMATGRTRAVSRWEPATPAKTLFREDPSSLTRPLEGELNSCASQWETLWPGTLSLSPTTRVELGQSSRGRGMTFSERGRNMLFTSREWAVRPEGEVDTVYEGAIPKSQGRAPTTAELVMEPIGGSRLKVRLSQFKGKLS